jgi:hypothetical protein
MSSLARYVHIVRLDVRYRTTARACTVTISHVKTYDIAARQCISVLYDSVRPTCDIVLVTEVGKYPDVVSWALTVTPA